MESRADSHRSYTVASSPAEESGKETDPGVLVKTLEQGRIL